MRWPFANWLRGAPAGTTRRPVRASAAGSAVAPEPVPGPRVVARPAAWREVPPLQRAVGAAPLTAPSVAFARDLAGRRTPDPMLVPLGHDLAADGPAGLVSGIAVPLVQRAPLRLRSAGPSPRYPAPVAFGRGRQTARRSVTSAAAMAAESKAWRARPPGPRSRKPPRRRSRARRPVDRRPRSRSLSREPCPSRSPRRPRRPSPRRGSRTPPRPRRCSRSPGPSRRALRPGAGDPCPGRRRSPRRVPRPDRRRGTSVCGHAAGPCRGGRSRAPGRVQEDPRRVPAAGAGCAAHGTATIRRDRARSGRPARRPAAPLDGLLGLDAGVRADRTGDASSRRGAGTAPSPRRRAAGHDRARVRDKHPDAQPGLGGGARRGACADGRRALGRRVRTRRAPPASRGRWWVNRSSASRVSPVTALRLTPTAKRPSRVSAALPLDRASGAAAAVPDSEPTIGHWPESGSAPAAGAAASVGSPATAAPTRFAGFAALPRSHSAPAGGEPAQSAGVSSAARTAAPLAPLVPGRAMRASQSDALSVLGFGPAGEPAPVVARLAIPPLDTAGRRDAGPTLSSATAGSPGRSTSAAGARSDERPLVSRATQAVGGTARRPPPLPP